VLLTAQRVVSPQGVTGVNVYQFLHGSYMWVRVPSEFLPDSNPGELVDEWLEVSPGENKIVSYLDVVLPDESSSTDILQRLASMKRHIQPVNAYVEAYWDPYWIRFGTSIDARMRATELGALSGHILLSLSGHPRSPKC
jgi:hypothetical protein